MFLHSHGLFIRSAQHPFKLQRVLKDILTTPSHFSVRMLLLACLWVTVVANVDSYYRATCWNANEPTCLSGACVWCDSTCYVMVCANTTTMDMGNVCTENSPAYNQTIAAQYCAHTSSTNVATFGIISIILFLVCMCACGYMLICTRHLGYRTLL